MIKFQWNFPDFKGERWRSYTEFLPSPPRFTRKQTFLDTLSLRLKQALLTVSYKVVEIPCSRRCQNHEQYESARSIRSDETGRPIAAEVRAAWTRASGIKRTGACCDRPPLWARLSAAGETCASEPCAEARAARPPSSPAAPRPSSRRAPDRRASRAASRSASVRAASAYCAGCRSRAPQRSAAIAAAASSGARPRRRRSRRFLRRTASAGRIGGRSCAALSPRLLRQGQTQTVRSRTIRLRSFWDAPPLFFPFDLRGMVEPCDHQQIHMPGRAQQAAGQ